MTGASLSATGLAGAEAPEPCGLGPSDGIPCAEKLQGGRYSPNLTKWLRKELRRHAGGWPYPSVFRTEDGTRWIGWIDDEEWFIGTKLWRVLCDGTKAEVGCWTFPVSDLTKEPDFWARYQAIGRCAIDEGHSRYWDEERWLTDGDMRSCVWCGNHTQHLRRWTEIVERERWEPAP